MNIEMLIAYLETPFEKDERGQVIMREDCLPLAALLRAGLAMRAAVSDKTGVDANDWLFASGAWDKVLKGEG